MIHRKQRNHSVPSSSSFEPLLHCTKKRGRFSQPSKPTSSPSPDAISDSLSLSGCCNQQILSNPINDSDTESLEVGNALGFNMVGKEKDVAQALGTGLDKSFQ
ncbi:hypothetical protein Tco_0716647 [Tanacetum coccineum]